MKAIKFGVGVVLLAAAMHSAAERPRLDFKGLSPGGDGTVVTAHAAWDCKAHKLAGSDTVCTRRHETIAGAEAKLVLVAIKDAKILTVMVSFAQKDFATVMDALKLKYGEPTKTEKTVKSNRMGAEFPSQRATWIDGTKRMFVEERTSRVDDAALYITSEASTQSSAQQKAEQAEKNKNDL